MNNHRLKLHNLLLQYSSNVYFQPPENLKLRYPAIIYSLSEINNIYADDAVYEQTRAYQIILIDKKTDSEIADKLSLLSGIRFNRWYTSDNLNHYVFTILY